MYACAMALLNKGRADGMGRDVVRMIRSSRQVSDWKRGERGRIVVCLPSFITDTL
jgi:hypothetical protein